jgi:hypothetical protein
MREKQQVSQCRPCSSNPGCRRITGIETPATPISRLRTVGEQSIGTLQEQRKNADRYAD